MKTCSKCKQTKSLDSFYLRPDCKGGMANICKSCYVEKARRWKTKNPEKRSANDRRYRQVNKEKIHASDCRYRQANPEKCAESKRQWRQKNLEYYRRRQKTQYAIDPNFRLLQICRSRIQRALFGKSKSEKTIELLGCSIDQLKEWLEAQFTSKMSWGNYGKYWQIDHIKPCAKFDLSDPAQQKQCFNFTNLQPLWWKANLIKGDKWPASA